MKNTIKVLSVVLILSFVVCMFAACETKLEGTYKSDGLISQELTFDKDGNVTLNAFGLVDVHGTYKIEDNHMHITYTVLGISKDLSYSFIKEKNTIILDGDEYTKVAE